MRIPRRARARTLLIALASACTAAAFTPAAHADTDRLSRAEQTLDEGLVVEARAELLALRKAGVTGESHDRLVDLLAAAERQMRFLSDVEITLQKAELALKQGDLRLAEAQAASANRHYKATPEDRARAESITAEAASLRNDLQPLVAPALAQAISDFEAERYAEAKAGLASVTRINAELTQEQTALLNRYRDRIYELERSSGEVFEVEIVPLSLLRAEAPAGAAEATTALALAQQGGEGDPFEQAAQMDAQRLLSQANAAFEAGRYNEAAEQFEIVLTRYAQYLSDDDAAQARDRQLEAQTRIGGQDTGLINQTVESRQRLREQANAEFNNALDQASDALTRGDIVDARNLAAQARLRWNEAYNQGLFTEDAYRAGAADIDTLVSRIDVADEQQTATEIREREARLAREEAEARRQQESERQARIRDSLTRLRSLQAEHKYEEALQLADQVLFLDPENAAAKLLKDVLKDLILYQEFAEAKRERGVSYATETVEMERSLIVPEDIMAYPSDWPELSFRRGEIQSFVESGADRRVLATLDQRKIPATFDDNRLQDVITFIAQVTNLNVDVDWDSLDQIGIDPDQDISLELREVPARVVLDRVLEKAQADPFSKAGWAVNDGVLVIAADEALRRNTFIVIYDIRDLLFQIPDFDDAPRLDLDQVLNQGARGGGGSGSIFEDSSNGEGSDYRGDGLTEEEMMDRILDIIQTNVDFEGWRDNGGSTGVVQELNGNLIITNTAKNHREIQGLLNQLREIRSVQINVESRFLTVAQDFFEQIGFDLDIVFNPNGNGQFPAVQRQLEAFGQGSLADEGLSIYPSDIVTGRNGTNAGWTVVGVDANGNPTYDFVNRPFSIPAPDGWSPIPVQQDSIGITDALTRAAGTDFAQSVLGPVGSALNPALAVAGTFLDDIQVDFLVEATQADQRSVQLSAPRLTFSNGRSANISVVNQVGFVSDLTPVVGTSSVAFDPTIGRINSGFTLAVRGVASADRRYVTMTVQAAVSGTPTFTNQTVQAQAGGAGAGGGDDNVFIIPPAEGTIQIPTIDVTQVNTGVTVPDKGTILLGGQRLTNEIEIETGVPVLSKLPIINRFFTNRSEIREDRTLMILMKPTIIIQNEREEAEFPGLMDQLKNPFR